MLKVTRVLGSMNDTNHPDLPVDWVELDWDQLGKRIIRTTSTEGRDVAIELERAGELRCGDILFEDADFVVAVRAKPEDALIIKPSDMDEMGRVGWQIGNRHTPSVIEAGEIFVRFDPTMVELLESMHVEFERGEHSFVEPIKYGGHQH
ncbi:urease accessory protein UreE [Collinsella sp. AGMB00827]|uniref:Urease accessory protein UreE n=1 Tax=Collinsella ureilytica TaxID=2869515 RepID=A0ABS7MHN5_9ACTN|nr:urease accessory protein UreE [Collinsella urealyticum]MBY4796861.1 urease accessory protein UreE [Collinsella urealyticum]